MQKLLLQIFVITNLFILLCNKYTVAVFFKLMKYIVPEDVRITYSEGLVVHVLQIIAIVL